VNPVRRELLSVKEWQKRLSDNFSSKGATGGSMLDLFKVEDAGGHAFVTH